jgi:CheY-like chemotaxis protein
MSNLPIFYYPSTTIWVDDDKLFLDAATQINSSASSKTFSNPNDCFNYFESYVSPTAHMPFLRGAIEDERYETIGHSPVDMNVPSIYQLSHLAERLAEVSVMIVDYKMPEMKGIDLCKKLQSQPVKKILLTGEASYQEAVEAFNDNTIDRFIRKDSPTLVEDIKKYVSELSEQYFIDRTKGLLSHLEVENKLPLSDSKFTEFFKNICIFYGIKEYYLIDKNGSLILIDDKNRAHYLIIHTDRSLDSFAELNQGINEAKKYVESVTKREKIPFFGIDKESWQFEEKDWAQHFYSPKVLGSREKYYYTLTT